MPTPKWAKTLAKDDIENEQMIKRIKYRKIDLGLGNKEIAKSLGVSEWALYSWYRNPDMFTLGNLRGISKKLKIPLAELICGIVEDKK